MMQGWYHVESLRWLKTIEKFSWSGRSMLCRTTPYISPMMRSTFPFFHSLRFFSSPTISTISETLDVHPLSLLGRWLSIRPCTSSLFQPFHAWALSTSNSLIILIGFSESAPWASSPEYTSRPYRIMFGVSTSFSSSSLCFEISQGPINQISFNIHDD